MGHQLKVARSCLKICQSLRRSDAARIFGASIEILWIALSFVLCVILLVNSLAVLSKHWPGHVGIVIFGAFLIVSSLLALHEGQQHKGGKQEEEGKVAQHN